MRTLLLVCVIAIASVSPTLAGAFFISLTKREQVSGFYKTCWYNCAGGEVAVTIPSTRPCPFKVDAPDPRARSPR